MTSTTTAILLFLACGIVCLAIPTNKNTGFADVENMPSKPRGQRDLGVCREKNGRYPDPSQCDAYIECEDGVPQEKLCPDGLVFDPSKKTTYPCTYPIEVNCEGRPNRQPGEPSEHCPHQYGFFKVEGRDCGSFVNCVAGHAHTFHCPEGLAFNNNTYRCDWPDQVIDCNPEVYLGYHCSADPTGKKSEIQLHRDKNNCQNYFVCFNGQPRLQKCPKGEAFNEATQNCEDPANVIGCDNIREFNRKNDDYYNNNPLDSSI